MKLNTLFEEQKRYEKLNKKIKKLKKYTEKKSNTIIKNIIFTNIIIFFIIGIISQNIMALIISPIFGSLLGTIISVGMVNIHQYANYKKTKKLKLFNYATSKTEKLVKRNKKELKIYKEEKYKDLFLQTFIKKLKTKNKEEIIENGELIKNYLMSLDKKYKKEKREIENLINKKINIIDKKEKEKKRLTDLLKINQNNNDNNKINIIQNL